MVTASPRSPSECSASSGGYAPWSAIAGQRQSACTPFRSGDAVYVARCASQLAGGPNRLQGWFPAGQAQETEQSLGLPWFTPAART
jgi:hypothetical protein